MFGLHPTVMRSMRSDKNNCERRRFRRKHEVRKEQEGRLRVRSEFGGFIVSFGNFAYLKTAFFFVTTLSGR